MSQRDDMIRSLGSERLLELLNTVDQAVSQTDEAHFVDDDVLLERWSAGSLTREEYEQIVQHISRCYECSQVLRDMIDGKVFALPKSPAADEADSADQAVAQSAGNVTPAKSDPSAAPRRQARTLIATVVCTLIALVGYFGLRTIDDRDSNVMLAQADYGQLTHYLSDAEFASVASGEFAKGPTTTFIAPDVDRDLRLNRIAERVQKEPSTVAHRLDYGQVLLEAGRVNDADREFQMAQKLDAGNPFAMLGLAIVLFQEKKTDEAEQAFSVLADDGHVGVAAKLNQIVCLIGLERKPEAREIWKSVPMDQQPEILQLVLAAGMNPDESEDQE